MRKSSSKRNLKNAPIPFLIVVAASVLVTTVIIDALSSRPKKNLILISIDTLRADHMGTYSYNKNTTPNIDAWAKNATVFDNAYTQVPSTYPSFAALMTGISPFESRIYTTGDVANLQNGKVNRYKGSPPLNTDVETLAQILKDNDYATSGLSANAALHPYLTNLNRGFDKYEITSYDEYEESSGNLTTKAIQQLESYASSEKPFFLWAHFLDPHGPYLPDKDSACKMDSDFCKTDTENMIYSLDTAFNKLKGCRPNGLDNKTVESAKALYDSEISETDVYVGKILQKIKDLKLDKNSVIIITADHGESFGNDYYFNHVGVVNESTVKVPLIISYPESKSGKRLDQHIQNTDLFSTMLGLLDIKPKRKHQGYNYSTLIQNKNAPKAENRPIFFINAQASKFAIRKGAFKYIYSLNEDNCSFRSKRELYDIVTDPHEAINLIDSEEKTAGELHHLLATYLNSHPITDKNKAAQEMFSNDKISAEEKRRLIDELKSLGY